MKILLSICYCISIIMTHLTGIYYTKEQILNLLNPYRITGKL